ncbi:MAG TPA: hypothetical protein VN843_25310, partial [Anaerolineales bacterium]|nr:hypothetical protein [Anaerolineales bacterium]
MPGKRLQSVRREGSVGKLRSSVIFDYIKLIGELNDEERLEFYEYLAHNLTSYSACYLVRSRIKPFLVNVR